MHEGLVDQASRFKKRIASDDLSNYRVVSRGQLVVGFPIDEGVLDFQEQYSTGIVSPAYNIWDVVDDGRVDRRYLKLALRSPGAFAYYRSKLRGSTARRRSLPTDVFLALPIPLPAVSEQRRIAAILDHADALRAKRLQVVAHLDALTQSIFHDMFGDPMTNDRSLPLTAIGDIAQVVTGNSPSRADAANFGDDIEWIKSDNLGGATVGTAEEGLSKQGRRKARTAPSGSILVTCIAGSRGSIGKASIVDREVAFNQQINAILPSTRVDAAFLLGQLKTAPELVRSKSTGGMKGLVSKSAFQSIEVLAPPIEAQREFSSRVAAVGRHQVSVQHALAADDELFTSLQARAFDGRL